MKDYQILKSTKTMEGKVIRIGNLLIDRSLSMQSLSSKIDRYYIALSNQSVIKLTAACVTGRAWVALKRDQYDLAIELALEALSIDNHSNDELTITTLNCLGGAYSKQKNYSAALKYYTQAYDLSKPTDDKIAHNSYCGPCIPIDKHAMYDNYRNISSINIARIHQKRGDTQLAWEMYREAVDCEMRDTTDFHCHTCMTIAESGTHKPVTTSEEHNRIWQNWKNFLDHGLVDILKYRTSVVTGYFSFNHQYDFPSRRYNNSYCRTMAIDYFRKVECCCEPNVSNDQYYLYTLQCYERLAELYLYWDYRSIQYYEKMIRLCFKYHPKDSENLIVAFKGMTKTYQQQQQQLKKQNNSEDISKLLCADDSDTDLTQIRAPMTPPVTPMTPPTTPLTPTISGSLFQPIKPLHFAFGWHEKWIDPRLQNESDLRKRIIYCHMRLASLYYDHQQPGDAKHSLTEATLSCQQFSSELSELRRLCNENLLIMKEDFDIVIQSYKNRLSMITANAGHCIDEENYCYIAQLYQKKNHSDLALEFLRKPVEYFEEYDYVCSHTIDCYMKLAEHYQEIRKDEEATISTYQRAIKLIKKHRSEPMATMISIIEEHSIDYLIKNNDLKTLIGVGKTLCEIIRHETTDITVLYNRLKRVLKWINTLDIKLHTYGAFLHLILSVINPLTSQMTLVSADFRDHFIPVCKTSLKLSLAIDIYEALICLLFEHQTNTMKIIDEYRRIAVRFKKENLLDDSVAAYEKLLNFVCQHHSTGGFIEGDLIRSIFYIWKHEIIKQYSMKNDFHSVIQLHYKMISFIEKYRTSINIEYNVDEFISITLQNYKEIVAIYQSIGNHFEEIMNIYQKQIDFLIKYQNESVQKQINTIFSQCQQLATDHQEQALQLYTKLMDFLQTYRLNYLSHLSMAFRELAQLDRSQDKVPQFEEMSTIHSHRVVYLRQQVADYKQKAKNYLYNNQSAKAILVYRNELLPFLLENHARDDEQIATCYKQMASLHYQENAENTERVLNDYQKAIKIYETQRADFYTDYAFELNPNVARRYAGTLFTCYSLMTTIYTTRKDQMLAETCRAKANDLYERYKDHFQFKTNPATNTVTVEICPFVELGY